MLLKIDGLLRGLSPRDAIDTADVIYHETCEKISCSIQKRAESVAAERGRWDNPGKVALALMHTGGLLGTGF